MDPNDADVHTQNVENMWARLKRKFKRGYGTSNALFPTYLQEFMFRQQFARDGVFGGFFHAVATIYVV